MTVDLQLNAHNDINDSINNGLIYMAMRSVEQKFSIKYKPHKYNFNDYFRASDHYRFIHLAAYHGDIKALKYLLENNVEIWHKDKNNKTALEIAAQRGHIEFCNILSKIKHTQENYIAAIKAALKNNFFIIAYQITRIAGLMKVAFLEGETLLDHAKRQISEGGVLLSDLPSDHFAPRINHTWCIKKTEETIESKLQNIAFKIKVKDDFTHKDLHELWDDIQETLKNASKAQQLQTMYVFKVAHLKICKRAAEKATQHCSCPALKLATELFHLTHLYQEKNMLAFNTKRHMLSLGLGKSTLYFNLYRIVCEVKKILVDHPETKSLNFFSQLLGKNKVLQNKLRSLVDELHHVGNNRALQYGASDFINQAFGESTMNLRACW